MLPFVTSLKTQVFAGPVVELQVANAVLFASEYSVTFAFPWRCPVF